MGQKIVLLVVGLAVGIGVGYVVAGGVGTESSPGKESASLETRIADLERAQEAGASRIEELESELEVNREALRQVNAEKERLATRIEEMEAAGPVEAGPLEPEDAPGSEKPAPTYEDLAKALGKLEGSFQEHMFGRDEKLQKEIEDLFAKASPEDVEKMLDQYRDADNLMAKTVLAHFIGMSHHPAALRVLEETIRDPEGNVLDRRAASHGLAFSGAESAKPLLRELAKENPDRGTRANAAFGLYRMNDPEAVDLYFKATDEAFAEKDPVAVAYLGGLSLMDDRALPAARERLKKYENWQAKVQLIMFIQGRKDKASVNLLTEIARDESQNPAVRKAAEDAIKTIEK